jgi:hypothetical protein
MQRTYTVVLLRDEEEGGYVVWVPALGTFSRPCGSAIHRANHATQPQTAH